MAKVTMPRVTIVPNVENSTINVQLTKATQINAGNPSAFPLAKDNVKVLNYQSAAKSELKTQLAEYYAIMNRIMAGTKTDADLANLTTLTTQIREFVLTDDDYNLVVGALQNMQTYILNFMYTDINNKAKAMDAQLNAVIGDINRFMSDLETVYSKSPSQYPIPDKSVLTAKLEQPVQDTLTYTNSTRGVIISNTKPANPVSKEIIWFNTGTPVR